MFYDKILHIIVLGFILLVFNSNNVIAATFINDFNTSGNYVFDNTQIVVDNGIARLRAKFDAYWRFEENSWNGTADEVKDVTYNNHHGVEGGGADTIGGGIIGRGGTFVATNKQYVDFGSIATNPGLDDFSYGIWFKTSSAGLVSLMARSVYSAADGRYAIIMNNGIVTSLLDLGTQHNIAGGVGLNDNNWHFVVSTIDRGGNHQLFIDGASIASTNIAANSAFDFSGYVRNLYMGAYNNTTGINPHPNALYYQGQLDEPFFIRRLLTSAEITEIYNGGNGKRIIFAGTNPYITPTNTLFFPSTLSAFTENVTSSNEGLIIYQVSTDNGITWKYWNGSAWTITTAIDGTETSPASEINTHIASLDIDGGDFTYRAYLNSDEGQKVELDQISIEYSLAPPTPTVTPDLQDGSDLGVVNNDNITSQNTPIFDVKCSLVGNTINLYSDNPAANTLVGTHICTGSGIEQVTTIVLPDGVHNVVYTDENINEESAYSPSLAVTIDTSIPATPTITAIADDTGESATDHITTDNTLILFGTAEPISVIDIFLNGVFVGVATTNGSGNFSFDYTGTNLSNGNYIFTAMATDVAGNNSPQSNDFMVVINTELGTMTETTLNSDDTNNSTKGSSSIGNTIWLDENNNGKQDKGEEGLEDIRVKLIWYGPNGKYDHGKGDDYVWRTDTNHNGHYKFDNLPKGKYRVIVKEEDVKKYIQTYDPDKKIDGRDTVKLRDGQDYTKADFGYNDKETELAKTGDNAWWKMLIPLIGMGVFIQRKRKALVN